MKTRRQFLGAVGAIAALGGAAVQATREPSGDAFDYRGWVVKWCDWRDLPAQVVTLGFWIAMRNPYEGRLAYSTTMGYVGTAREMEQLNATLHQGWPIVNVFTPASVKAETKARAKRALLAHLDQA